MESTSPLLAAGPQQTTSTPLLASLEQWVQSNGRLDPMAHPDVSPRYIQAARALVVEATGADTAWRQALDPYLDVETTLSMEAGAPFVDELVFIAANEAARQQREESNESYYEALGAEMVRLGLEGRQGLFLLAGRVHMGIVLTALGRGNRNFNSVTTLRTVKTSLFRPEAILERYTHPAQRKRYRETFGARGARQILRNNCATTQGVLKAIVTAVQGEGRVSINQTSCEAQGDDACRYHLRWTRRPVLRPFRGSYASALQQELLEVEARFAQEAERAVERQRRRAERQIEMLRREKAALARDASAGRVVRGYAHDLASSLTVLSFCASSLTQAIGRSRAASGDVLDLLSLLNNHVDRADTLLRDLRDFANTRESILRPEPTSTRSLLEDVHGAFVHLARSRGVSLQLDLRQEAIIEVDPVQMSRALENLVSNAIDALSEPDIRGERRARGRTPRIVLLSRAAGMGRVHLEVTDNGPGIPQEITHRLFEPGVSGRGSSGIGLSVVRHVVEQHGGAVSFKTSEAGTSFTILLSTGRPEEGRGD